MYSKLLFAARESRCQRQFRKALLILLCLPFFLIAANSASADSPPDPKVQGYVDSIVITDKKIVAQGWIGEIDPSVKVVAISIWIDKVQAYKSTFVRFARPDVVAATGRKDWLNSGWRIEAPLGSDLKNRPQAAKVLAELSDGRSSELLQSEKPAGTRSRLQLNDASIGIVIALFFICLVTVIVFIRADELASWISVKSTLALKPYVVFALALFSCFLLFIGLGLTGSSIGAGLQNTQFVQSDVVNIFGKDRPIRSDEWLVFTPLAVAQYNHNPEFPIVNQNIGEDGQNMLVVGMAGAPVAHISTVAKPATWGFFLFDLKRALSWYWFFPLFACLFSLWGVVALLLRGHWRYSFLIALCFICSPYVAAWSNWPAYTVFFPSLAFVVFIAILRVQSRIATLGLGFVLGAALAGYVLVLYPPWQISLGYVFLAMAIGVMVRDRLYRNLTIIRAGSYGIAFIIASLLLWAWWHDAHEAIQAMQSTVYPGQRTMVPGGSTSSAQLLRGFTNFVTLEAVDGSISNQSEIASFSYMFLPLAALLAVRLYQKAAGLVEVLLSVAICFILYFMLVGIPPEVAQLTLWGRVPDKRADLALGLSTIILSALLIQSVKPVPKIISYRILAFACAVAWLVIALSTSLQLHETIRAAFSLSVLAILSILIVGIGYCLLAGHLKSFVLLYLLLSVATIWWFNPINLAPHKIEAAMPKAVPSPTGRMLVLGTQIPSMYLLASGLPVVNGVFYYPQKSIWNRLDPSHAALNTYNRYQHLIFTGGDISGDLDYRIESPNPDVVSVVVRLERFDFRKTGAELIVAPQSSEGALRKNAGLMYLATEKGWVWFQTIELNRDAGHR